MEYSFEFYAISGLNKSNEFSNAIIFSKQPPFVSNSFDKI